MYKPLTPPPKTANNQIVISDSSINSTERINEIDALRGIVLLGILLVHTANLFGLRNELVLENFSSLGLKINNWISFILANRCAPVFNILFGVSFFLILKKSTYSSGKFIWRCFLLILIGILNKIFYTYDALMWYGLWGIILTAFRYLNPKILLTLSISLYILGCYLSQFSLGKLLFPVETSRYFYETSLSEIVTYPMIDNVKDYLHVVFNGGIFQTLGLMTFGYAIAKSGFLFKFKAWATFRNSILLFMIFIITQFLTLKTGNNIFWRISNISGFIFTSVFFLYLYNKIKTRLIFLEAYGRMGLTNYSMQGIIGIISLYIFLLPEKYDFTFILAYFFFIYLCQCAFSYYWLKYFKYGPMEYIWRSLTNFKFVNPLKEKPKAKTIPSLENA